MFKFRIDGLRIAIDSLPLLVVAAWLPAVATAAPWLPDGTIPLLAAALLFARRDARVGARTDAADPERATKEGGSRMASRRRR